MLHINWLENHKARRELPELTRQLAILLRSGERLDKALKLLGELTQTAKLRSILAMLHDGVRAGNSLTDLLNDHRGIFSEFFISVVAVGEKKGDIASALERIAEYLQRQRKLKDSLVNALTYPLLLIVITGMSVLILMIYVLPQFQELFDDAGISLPWFTQGLLSLSQGLQNYGWAIVLAFAFAIAIGWKQLQQPKIRYRWHQFVLSLPLSDLVRRIDVARFSDSLAVALSGGTPLIEGLRLSQASVANRFIRRSLDNVINSVKEGGRLGESLRHSAVFPPMASRMIEVGEESGKLATALEYVAEVYDNEFNHDVKRLINILEPVLIIFVGGIIGAIILAMVAAIQQLNNWPV